MNPFKFSLILFTLLTAFLASCEDKDITPPNEEELITTLEITLTPSGGGDPVILLFRDLDGDGGQAPEITSGELAAGITYDGQIEIRNESTDPVKDITEEILEEGEDHQFFFISREPLVPVSITYTDEDAEGNPIGLQFTLRSEVGTIGRLGVVLRHLPNKSAPGVRDGDITQAGGETDIEVEFPVVFW